MGKAARSRPKKLPEKLKQIRESLGLTQKQIISFLGYNFGRTYVSAFERGILEPPFDVLLAYSRAANVYLEALIDDQLDLPKKLPCRRKSLGVPARKIQPKTFAPANYSARGDGSSTDLY